MQPAEYDSTKGLKPECSNCPAISLILLLSEHLEATRFMIIKLLDLIVSDLQNKEKDLREIKEFLGFEDGHTRNLH